MELDKFEEFLTQGNMAKNTISAYMYAVKEFGSRHKELNKRNLLVSPLEVGQGAATFLFGECHQQCRLHLLEEQVEEGRQLGVVLCGAFLGCDWCQSERTCANQG